MDYQNETAQTQDLFTEIDTLSLVEASTGQRFLNMLIDGLLINYGLAFATGAAIMYTIIAISPDTAYEIYIARDSATFILGAYFIAFINYVLYYTLCEKLFKGYTLGKLITGTKAIMDDGTNLTWKAAFIRSISRMVPFEVLSMWIGGRFWHDSWAKTVVIKAR